ncbi:MAG: ATP-binding protein [Myxococcota bacterium]
MHRPCIFVAGVDLETEVINALRALVAEEGSLRWAGACVLGETLPPGDVMLTAAVDMIPALLSADVAVVALVDEEPSGALSVGAHEVVRRGEELASVLRFRIQSALARKRLDDERQAALARAARERRFLERERRGLARVENQLSTILGEASDLVAAMSLDRQALFINAAGLSMIGFDRDERLFGLSMLDVCASGERERFDDVIVPATVRDGKWTGSLELAHRAGHTVSTHVSMLLHTDPSGGPQFMSVIARDMTERKRMEEQLRQSQKIEAVGRLAGGVAHDFNNLLTAIFSFGRFALESIEVGSPARHDLAEVLAAADRAKALTKQLLAFSRKQTVSPRVLDINDIIGGLERLLQRLVREDIHFQIDLAPGLWTTRIDPGAFEQVLVNLAVNARDAMPDGGQIAIRTENRTIGDGGDYVDPGDYILISVTDGGVGIPKEILDKVFDPFFTTKEQGKGTGLGLSMCYGIVKQAGGYIDIVSQGGSGTTFNVYLPRVSEALDAVATESPDIQHGGAELVLVAEDNAQVRRLATRILERQGYHVVSAGDGQEALEHARRLTGPVDLLLTDVVMPVMSGRELAERLTAESETTRVLFMSGYAENQIVEQGEIPEGIALINKPFTPQQLASKVRDVLDADLVPLRLRAIS